MASKKKTPSRQSLKKVVVEQIVARKTTTKKKLKASTRSKAKVVKGREYGRGERDKEVLRVLKGNAPGRPARWNIAPLAEAAFPDVDIKTAQTWTRGILQRGLGKEWVEKTGRGEYRIASAGREQLQAG